MAEVDVSDVQGGTYVLVVQSWDEITSKPGEPYDFVTHRYGDEVELSKFEARRLVGAGAVVSKEDFEKKTSEPAPAETAVSVLDDEALAELRDKLDLDEDADQATILAALDDRLDADPADPAPWWGAGDEPTTIDAITERVGEDRALAAAALAAETASSTPRVTLIEKLAAVVTAGS